jgi:predicted metal-dependent HD superfamily phosphohydrolase
LIGQARAFQAELANPAAVILAVWYHDAIYRPRRSDNEAESAALARRDLGALGAIGDLIEVVIRLIQATQRHQPPTGLPDAALFLDSDLAILGNPPPVYAAYRAAIRREYRWVPAPIYRRKRAEVLTAFLERERIYLTQRYRALEEPARANLAAEIAGG